MVYGNIPMNDPNLPPTPPGAVTASITEGGGAQSTEVKPTSSAPAVKPVHVDGTVIVLMGSLTALMTALDSDQAKAILHPMPLFIAQTACLTINGGLVALNGFRSLVFAKSKE